MKKLSSFVLMACMLTFLLTGFAGGSTVSVYGATPDPSTEFRAIWVSSAYNLDFPSKAGLSDSDLMKEVDAIVNRAVEMGMNALIVQVRPAADALYPSSLFPWSDTLTGVQGQAPANGFDPLAYWVQKAHENGLELHAWINPFRITYASRKITDVNALSSLHPARQNPSWAIRYQDALYFDPGRPECRQLIADGAAEIISRYAVDGIHLDDYFYPGTDFSDDATYKLYGGGRNKDDWRRENVNNVIQLLQKTIKDINPNIRFGVSPTAIWQNASSDPNGSDTRGYESYKSAYADTRRWVKEGWLDYICPQIYWYIGYEIADYEKVLSWWEGVCQGTGVDLYVGQAAYRENEGQANWSGEILRQLNRNARSNVVRGSVFFRMASLTGSVGDQIKNFYRSRDALAAITAPATPTPSVSAAPAMPSASPASSPSAAPANTSPMPSQTTTPTPAPAPSIIMDKLTVAQPSGNVTVSNAKGYTVLGTSDPNKPLYLNGQQITNRTQEGFFSAYVGLSKGNNTYTFSQDGQTSVTRTITLKDAAAGSSQPAATQTITEIPASRNYYATVTAASAWLYSSHSANGGSSWQVVEGQKDRVTGMTKDNKWVRLACGGWIDADNVSLSTETTPVTNALTNGVYITGETEDILQWNAAAYPCINADFDGNQLVVRFGMQTGAPSHMINMASTGMAGALFKDMQTGTDNGAPCYRLTLQEGARLEGFYVDYSDGTFKLHLKRRKALSDSDKPLSGFSFTVDAGHGDTDFGASGPMGKTLAEKHINLSNALKLAERLENLGASVTLTRSEDVFYSLYERTEISRAANPDMFISMHANSMPETTDSVSIRGLTVWYRNPLSRPLADVMANLLFDVNPLTTRQAVSNQSNFYVCRPSWTPSVIIETSFMCNIHDFAWLINEANQNEMADRIVFSILSYYQ